MIVIGLTGSIGMGKSTVSKQFSLLGAKVASADDFVHYLLKNDTKIIADIAKEFPNAVIEHRVLTNCKN